MVILVRLKWWYWHEFGLRPFIFSSVIILASWAGDFLAWVSKGVSEFKQDLNKSAELSPSDSNIYFISHSCNLFGPSLQNANPNSNLLFSVTLKCTFSLNSLSSYLSCSHQYLLSCKKPFAVCMLMQEIQPSWVLFPLKLPPQACLLRCSGLRAAGWTQPLFVPAESSHHTVLVNIQLPLTQTQFPKLGLGTKPTIFPLPNQSGHRNR